MKSAKAYRKQLHQTGTFYTSEKLALLMKSYIGETDEIYDPTCGEGALLSVFDDNVQKYGQELDENSLNVAKSNLKNFTGVCGDTLAQPAFMDRKFQSIIANPPFSVSWQPLDDERFICAPRLAPKSRADWAFVLHCYHMLADNGIATILCFPGILYRSNAEYEIRRWFVNQGCIKKIIGFQGGYFEDTNIATALMVIQKDGKMPDYITFEDKENDIVKDVPLSDIRQNDYNLSVSSYCQKEIVKPPFDEVGVELQAREGLKTHLRQSLSFSQFVTTMCKDPRIDLQPFLKELHDVISEFETKDA